MEQVNTYSIGTPGKKWDDNEKALWLEEQSIKRSYQEEVLAKLLPLKSRFDLLQYGALSMDPERYPLFAIRTKNWNEKNPNVLITGGVHGYETSGVQGAIRFAESEAENFADDYNILIIPCISPWGYETINRWNQHTVDPNRSFRKNSPSEEAAALIEYLSSLNTEFIAHFDLHETTDSDNSEFMPARAARDGEPYVENAIPDGFYLVGSIRKPEAEFQKAMIDAVRRVTHIAPPDDAGKLIGVKIAQDGVVNLDVHGAALCAGVTDAAYVTTTEVYPDSPKVDDENCILAQVAAVVGGLNFIREKNTL